MSRQPQAWFCSHEHEPHGGRTHVRDHTDARAPRKRAAGTVDPTVTKAVTFGRYNRETEGYDKPLCPLAVPLYPDA